jgi:hypothetical protein
MKIRERKFEILEERACSECGRSYIYDLYWHRQYSIKVKDSPINTPEFHSLCGEHKLALYRAELARAYFSELIDDRDIERMGLSLRELVEE